jgi:hypothetical protein
MKPSRLYTATVATAAGAGIGLTIVAGLADASPASSSIPQPGRIVIHQEASTLLVLNQDPNSLVGNEFADTWTALRDGTAAGSAATVCQAVLENADHSAVFQCMATVTLARGELTAQGTATLGEQGQQDFRLAVTGGTGAYRLARGDVLVHYRNAATRVLYFRLAP